MNLAHLTQAAALAVHSSSSALLQVTEERMLLNELQYPSTARPDQIKQLVESGHVTGTDTVGSGENVFHLLIKGDFSADLKLSVLKILVKKCKNGLRAHDNYGNLPLHLCFLQHKLMEDITEMILAAYPQGAAVANDLGLIPLFLCVMREDTSAALCRALCRANPAGPSTMNKTHSYPLHFAAKRAHPNHEVVKYLLKKFPAAAAHANDYGRLPLHCLCATSDDRLAAKMLYGAFKDGIQAKDRHGRTCLHLAVLNVGKDHCQALAKEEEELMMEAQRACSRRLMERNNSIDDSVNSEDTMVLPCSSYDCAEKPLSGCLLNAADADVTPRHEADTIMDSDAEDDDEEEDTEDKILHDELIELKKNLPPEVMERDGTSRAVVKFLIDRWPQAMLEMNNFNSTPVDTVLAEERPIKTKRHVVTTYGLYNDAPTARLLLLAQTNHLAMTLSPRHALALRDYNWVLRREAVLVSLVGESSVFANIRAKIPAAGIVAKTTAVAAVPASPASSKNKKNSNRRMEKKIMKKMATIVAQQKEQPVTYFVTDEDIPRNNILARLRRHGLEDVVRLTIQYL